MEAEATISELIKKIYNFNSTTVETRELNTFFKKLLKIDKKNLNDSPELFDLYADLSKSMDKEKLLKRLLKLQNFCSFEKIQGSSKKVFELGSGNADNREILEIMGRSQRIRVKVQNLSRQPTEFYFSELREGEVFGICENGDVGQGPGLNLKLVNKGGLLYINRESEAFLEVKSAELFVDYELLIDYFSAESVPASGGTFLVETCMIGFLRLNFENAFNELAFHEFSSPFKDLREIFPSFNSKVSLYKRINSWVLVCKAPSAFYLKLKPSYLTSWYFIPSGFSLYFNKTHYRVKYSYIS